MLNYANCKAQCAKQGYETAYAHENSFEMTNHSSHKGQTILDEILAQENATQYHNNIQSEIINTLDWTKVGDTTEAPFRYICQISIFANGTQYFGSGVLVGPKTVLTAAHNIWNDVTNALCNLKTDNIIVTPGKKNNLAPFGTSKAVKLIPATGYNNAQETTKLDYGIIHLDKPIGNDTGFWSMSYKKWSKDTLGTSILPGNLPQNTGNLKVNLSGYPYSPKHKVLGYTPIKSYDNTVQIKNGMLLYKNDSKGGHSGSPIWVRRHSSMGGRVLVGIHVCCRGTKIANKAVFIDKSIRDFITANTI